MEDIFKLDITEEEARQMDAEIERMLAAMRQANEKIAREQRELEELQAETRDIIARMRERQRVETTF
jgi:peptidoglycan hydrolase CwlO-like protein